ncbi:hypothetical protein [Blautia massiliensis (ex Durand et al. 2017)]|uniref:hypothetical protein n=1 Tax=Blautia massiliensis (ex Durand et al. 2017) TaxID=1737424 RepID=UPI002431A979|nr:hypothetical protein [Blautia massiliensis (ex Durand et al. 2017)]MDD6547438.1 hypothetical protein [Blautia massiliensis (ex Durand et al. 2017)]
MYINEAAKLFGTTKKAIDIIAGSGIPGKVSVSSFSGILIGSYRDPRTGKCLL